MNHKELVDELENDNVFIGIDLSVARKFFTTISFNNAASIVGSKITLEKAIVMFLFCISPGLVLASAACSFIFFKFYGFISILLLIIHFLYNGESSMPGRSLGFILKATISAIATFCVNEYYHLGTIPSEAEELITQVLIVSILFLSSLLCARLVYKSSGYFICHLIVQHEQFFLYMKDKITIGYASTEPSE